MHNADWTGSSGWWWMTMAIFMVAFWGVVVWLVVTVLRRVTATGGQPSALAAPTSSRPSAMDVLAERLARGEIDPEEYRRRRDALGER